MLAPRFSVADGAARRIRVLVEQLGPPGTLEFEHVSGGLPGREGLAAAPGALRAEPGGVGAAFRVDAGGDGAPQLDGQARVARARVRRPERVEAVEVGADGHTELGGVDEVVGGGVWAGDVGGGAFWECVGYTACVSTRHRGSM